MYDYDKAELMRSLINRCERQRQNIFPHHEHSKTLLSRNWEEGDVRERAEIIILFTFVFNFFPRHFWKIHDVKKED